MKGLKLNRYMRYMYYISILNQQNAFLNIKVEVLI